MCGARLLASSHLPGLPVPTRLLSLAGCLPAGEVRRNPDGTRMTIKQIMQAAGADDSSDEEEFPGDKQHAKEVEMAKAKWV